MRNGIAILYEHPEWFELLFAELERRGLPFDKVLAHELAFDPEAEALPELVVNRMSPSSWKRGHGNGIFTVRDYLLHLEERGVAMVNGSHAYAVEISKARQLDLFRAADVHYPRARVTNHPSRAIEAARGLEFPVVLKPNIGGSGAGIVRFDSPEQIASAQLDFGVDGTALVQEFLPAREGAIVRVEVLNGEFLYAIKIYPDFSSFNLCPADICQRDVDMSVCPAEAPVKKKLRIERANPPREAVEGALALAAAAQLDVGGIEYLINDRDGGVYFYDINALSNFVTDAVNIVGFDPTARFVDYLELRLAAVRGSAVTV
jgi:glutathione synthase/RimK-type ligase-like ATP-grasp enzyme